jgi:hypothetical protein
LPIGQFVSSYHPPTVLPLCKHALVDRRGAESTRRPLSPASSQERAAVMAALLLLIATTSLGAYRLTGRKALQWLD